MKKTLLILALALGMLPMALQAQTKNVARECVLFELFTGVRCPYCPAAANGVAQMLEEGLAIAPVGYHTSAFSTDLYYTNETNARANYYGINSYPTLKVDGVMGMSGGGGASETMYTTYRNYYNQRINVASPFTIDLSYEPVEGNNCRVNCTVNKVGDCNGTDVRVFIALTQCNIDVAWQGMQGLHHVCRDMIPTQTGTPFTGTTMTISETFEMLWPKEDCYLTAWVQNYSGSSKEVYQAVRLSTALDLDYDLVLKDVESVVSQNCSGAQSPRLVVKNYGHETITSFVMRAYDGSNSYSQTWEGTLAEGETVEALMDEFVADKCDEMQFFVEQPNGHDDGFPVDNMKSAALTEPPTIDGALTLQLKTSSTPENLSFEVRNMDTDEVEYNFTFDEPSHVYRIDFVLSHAACYRLTARDVTGEGMGNGFFQVKDSENHVVFRGGNSGYEFTYETATELHSDGSVSVEENGPATGFSVTPNPTSDIVNINLGKGQWHIQVFDIMGRKVMEQNCEGQSSLDFSHQQKGLYMLKARNDAQEYNTKIVVR
jgi:hypothetical protein